LARASPAVTTAAPRLRLYLLGPFCVESEKGPIRLPTRKVESLLAYLALHPESNAREKLAALFWGDSPDTQARGSLRKALTLLREHLSKDIVIADRESIRLNPDTALRVDALEFEKIAHSESPGESLLSEIENLQSQRDFQSAIALYRGDLLPDFYDDWILTERERFRALYLNALLRLVQELRTRSEYDRAIEYAQKALATDPANEHAHRHLMFCFVATGNRQAALEQYRRCEQALREELSVEPAPETTALYH
jgi:DNA-binding SARP family transcriptional activator